MIDILIVVLNLLALVGLGWLITKTRRPASHNKGLVCLLDTSALIDGRILEVAHTGFLPTHLMLPEFILSELQHIADSPEELRRSRGRLGLDVVKKLQAMGDLSVEVIEDRAPDVEAVDDKLVAIAKAANAAIITTDYNLNQVATINGIKVLNVNELAQALRPLALPGERVKIKLVQRGSDHGQAVGYLDDGTMVVVDRAHRLIGQEVEAEVNRIMQTVAGKMLFARLLSTGSSEAAKDKT